MYYTGMNTQNLPVCHFDKVILALITNNAVRATEYVNPKLICRATRKLYGKRMPDVRHNIEITLTVGKPNYMERDFIKKCLKAGEPFPVKKIQLKLYKPKNK